MPNELTPCCANYEAGVRFMQIPSYIKCYHVMMNTEFGARSSEICISGEKRLSQVKLFN